MIAQWKRQAIEGMAAAFSGKPTPEATASPLGVEKLQLDRSGVYYQPVPESEAKLELMRLIDGQFLETPYYGSHQMTRHLRRLGPRCRSQAGSLAHGGNRLAGDLPEAAHNRATSGASEIFVSSAGSGHRPAQLGPVRP